MKKKIFNLGLAAMAIAFSFHSNAQTKLTLKQCIDTGLVNNLDVLRSQLQMQSDKINMNQSKMNLLPNLNGNAGQTWSQGRSIDPYSNTPITQGNSSSYFSLGSNVVLFNGFSLMNAIKQYTLAYKASEMDWQQMKDNLTINIILAYIQVLSNVDQLAQSKIQATYSAKQIERLEVLNKEGAIKPSDLADLRAQYAGDQISIINSQNSLELSKISLFQLLNIPYIKDLELERIETDNVAPKYEDGADVVYENALKTLALVKAADFRLQSAGKAVKVARGQLYPTLSFGINAQTTYSSVARQSQYQNTTYVPTTDSAFVNPTTKYPVYRYQDNFGPSTKIGYSDQLNNNIYTSYGFTLNVPIFNRLQQRNRLKQAKITLKLNEYTVSSVRTQVNQAVNQAYVNMISASDRFKAVTDQVAASTESFRAAEVRFNEGVGTSIDYLLVKNTMDRANIGLINAKYDYLLRMKVLDFYEGKPLW
ncbi:MAG: TolC family protein [Bacteroidota bacterium]